MTTMCPNCGGANRPQSRFCKQCGQPLPSPQAPVAGRSQRQRWQLGGGLLLLFCIGLLTWWGVATGLPARLFSVGSATAVAVGVDTTAVAATLPPPPAGATATSGVPAATPEPSLTSEPLMIPGLGIELPHLSDADEIAIGEEVAQQIAAEYRVLQDAAAQQRVEAIGQRIVPFSDRPNLTSHFTLLDTDEVNAFAAPGGFIFVTRGMLAFANPAPDDELANVIGHEIAHVARRHGAKRVERITLAIAVIEAAVRRNQDWERIYETQNAQITEEMVSELLVRGWGRNQEFDADHYGVLYTKQAGYNPNAAITLFLRMQTAFPPNSSGPGEQLLATHPPFADRIERLETVVSANP